MSRPKPFFFPGDSDCDQGLVSNANHTHVCQNCMGDGCKPKRNRGVATRRAERLRSLSGSLIVSDQKGRAVFINLEKGSAYVVED